jgi:hypothetical protein
MIDKDLLTKRALLVVDLTVERMSTNWTQFTGFLRFSVPEWNGLSCRVASQAWCGVCGRELPGRDWPGAVASDITRGHLVVVQLFLDHGTDVDGKNQDHWTELHLASMFG